MVTVANVFLLFIRTDLLHVSPQLHNFWLRNPGTTVTSELNFRCQAVPAPHHPNSPRRRLGSGRHAIFNGRCGLRDNFQGIHGQCEPSNAQDSRTRQGCLPVPSISCMDSLKGKLYLKPTRAICTILCIHSVSLGDAAWTGTNNYHYSS